MLRGFLFIRVIRGDYLVISLPFNPRAFLTFISRSAGYIPFPRSAVIGADIWSKKEVGLGRLKARRHGV
jgi:hypothetical protein